METLKEKIKFEIVNILNKYDDRVLTGFSIFEEFQNQQKEIQLGFYLILAVEKAPI